MEGRILENTLQRLCRNCQRATNIEERLARNSMSLEKRDKLMSKLDKLQRLIAADARTAEPVLRILRNFVTIEKQS